MAGRLVRALLLGLLAGCAGQAGDPDADAADAGRPDARRPDARRPTCGDEACEAGESTEGCPVDCPSVWRPGPGTRWQWQLQGTLDETVAATMFDLDLFDQPASTIARLRSAGRTVICYFSAGSREAGRPDVKTLPPAVVGKIMGGWDEQWLDIRAGAVRSLVTQRLDLARSKGCDGVEPDNVDGYANDTGFPLSASDQISFNRFVAREAHARGLSVGLKNDVDQVEELLPYFDWALNEECLRYGECDRLAPFIAARRAVFHVEYAPPASAAVVCPKVKPLRFDTLIKKLDLGAWVERCP